MSHTTKIKFLKLRRWLALWTGLCDHPVAALEAFHFGRDETHVRGHLCRVCFGKVDVPRFAGER